jgi:archaemetzincin
MRRSHVVVVATLAAAFVLFGTTLLLVPSKPRRPHASKPPTHVGADLPPPVSEDGHEKPGPPQPGDWLDRFKEDGQTLEEYVTRCANRRSPAREVFYIQPLGDAAERHRETLDLMRAYAEAFFGVPAKVCDPIPMFENGWVAGRGQYNSTMIIGQLAERLPPDALVYVGITGKDLFAPGLNFVFGEGSLRLRTGIYSLVRYDTPDPALFRRRALKLMAHEVGHILSIEHCVFYKCVMQGANSLAEDDRHPMHLCPVDQRKLQWNTGFNREVRYRKLEEFYRACGLAAEADWVAARRRSSGP